MSFDLSFWYEDALSTSERAAEIYDRLTDGEEGVVPSAPARSNLCAEGIATLGDPTEESMEESPWTSDLYRTPKCVIATLAYSRSEEAAPELARLCDPSAYMRGRLVYHSAFSLQVTVQVLGVDPWGIDNQTLPRAPHNQCGVPCTYGNKWWL